jgi:4-alpha-glucanotransferase
LYARHSDEIGLIEFVQWVADRQLSACAERARELRMAIGLYLDVAVGVDPAGFDAWHDQDAVFRELSIGAPPDFFNPAGQNWGLAGFNSNGLARTGYAPFRTLLQQSMRYAGAIRLDHVLGLKRLYVIPDGASADGGVYLRMPFGRLLEIISDASHAHRCIVIGEDLGTVPEGLRDALAAQGIWRYQVLIFERDAHGEFHASTAYARNAVVTNTTHDLPTFSAWCRADDIRLKYEIGQASGETADDRTAACTALAAALARMGYPALSFQSVVEFMNATPCRLLMISLEDILGLAHQPNVPGTTVEHPNWRHVLPVPLEQLVELREFHLIADLLATRQSRGVAGIR